MPVPTPRQHRKVLLSATPTFWETNYLEYISDVFSTSRLSGTQKRCVGSLDVYEYKICRVRLIVSIRSPHTNYHPQLQPLSWCLPIDPIDILELLLHVILNYHRTSFRPA